MEKVVGARVAGGRWIDEGIPVPVDDLLPLLRDFAVLREEEQTHRGTTCALVPDSVRNRHEFEASFPASCVLGRSVFL